jgi:ribosomal protein S18 acetylase RimI-like enzyme
LPVRNFTWEDLPALLDLVETVRFSGRSEAYFTSSYGRELWRRVFQETLAQPGLAPEDNCFVFETQGQIQGLCRLCPELAIGRTLLELDVILPTSTSQATEIRLQATVPGSQPAARSPREHEGDLSNRVERELVRRAVARSRELGARMVHTCIPKGSPRGRLLPEEGFSPARVYWDMNWQCLLPLTGEGRDAPTSAEITPGLFRDGRGRPSLPEGFHIRHFRPDHTESLTDAQNSAFGGSWGFCPNTVEQIQYRSAMSNTRHEGILLLCHGERIAGYCWTSLAPGIGQTKGIIDMIGVVPDYRGHSLSQPILLAAMEYLRSVGAAQIGLQVDSSNTPAIRLYNSVGFEKVRELQWFQFCLPVN